MSCPAGAVTTTTVSPLGQLDRGGAHPLQCVWTNHPFHDHCCREGIPAAVVSAAWQEELERDRVRGDRFFHFAWRGGVWLGYGLWDGGVRGVYCPAHSAARDARSSAIGDVYPVALTA